MTHEEDVISITVRSFLPPDQSIEGFDLGKPFVIQLPANSTLEELIENLFWRKMDQIGVRAINKEVAENTKMLRPGDQVDIFELVGGG
jgi:sulfur carrier protein ThiS